jgi:hypothetical protein
MLRCGFLKLGGGTMDEVGGGAGDLLNVHTVSRLALFVLIFSIFIFALSSCFLFFRSDTWERFAFGRVTFIDLAFFDFSTFILLEGAVF